MEKNIINKIKDDISIYVPSFYYINDLPINVWSIVIKLSCLALEFFCKVS